MSANRNLAFLTVLVVSFLIPTTAQANVITFGSNQSGQLCDGLSAKEQLYSTVPVGISVPGEVIQEAQGNGFSLMLNSAGQVYACGSDELGQVTGSQGPAVLDPTLVMEGVRQISAGGQFALALKTDGEVVGWGGSVKGEAGTANFIQPPREILSGATSISAGMQYGMAVLSNGHLDTWGEDLWDQLGYAVGPPNYTTTPREVPGLAGVAGIAGGSDRSWVLLEDGEVAQLGNNDPEPQPTGLTEVQSISGHWQQVVALDRHGAVWEYGNENGEAFPTPSKIAPAATAAEAGVSDLLISGGQLFSWGENTLGSLGQGSLAPGSMVPHPLSGVSEVKSLASAKAPAPTLLTFNDWKLTGSLNGNGLLGKGTLSGSFNGSGALHGQAEGSIKGTATYRVAGLSVSLGIETGSALRITSLGVAGMKLPLSCPATSEGKPVEPIGLFQTLSASELQASGSFRVPQLGCSYGWLVSVLVGPEAGYEVKATP